MNRIKWIASILLGAAGFAATTASAAPITVQPAEATSKDTFNYQFLPTFNMNGAPPFNALLSSGKTTTGHDTETVIEFDLTGVSLAPSEVATLNLWVTPTEPTGFGISPQSGFGVTLNVLANAASWTEATVSYGTKPAALPGIVATEFVDYTGAWVSFDVTSQVNSWLANPGTNFGFTIVQTSEVVYTVPGPNAGKKVVTVFDSAAGANSAHFPSLNVAAVPEPGSVGLVLMGGAALLLGRRRR